MTLLTYIGIALTVMQCDALACVWRKYKYRPIQSAILALIWPITSIIVILEACRYGDDQ